MNLILNRTLTRPKDPSDNHTRKILLLIEHEQDYDYDCKKNIG